MKINSIRNARYSTTGRLYFDSNVGNIEMEAMDALDIAYILFDYMGMSYSELDKISEILEEN